MVEAGVNGVHHVMVELVSLDDVGQGYDIAQGQEGRVGVMLEQTGQGAGSAPDGRRFTAASA